MIPPEAVGPLFGRSKIKCADSPGSPGSRHIGTNGFPGLQPGIIADGEREWG